MGSIEITARRPEDQAWVEALLLARWGGGTIVSRGRVHDAAALPAFVAHRGGSRQGLATWRIEAGELELVTLDAVTRSVGVGTALLVEVAREARAASCGRCVLITTNDNLDALAFYQKRGWRLTGLNPGAIDRARAIKPGIPFVGDSGVPIRDELELTLPLERA